MFDVVFYLRYADDDKPIIEILPSSLRSLRLFPAAAYPLTAPKIAPAIVAANSAPPIAANGNNTSFPSSVGRRCHHRRSRPQRMPPHFPTRTSGALARDDGWPRSVNWPDRLRSPCGITGYLIDKRQSQFFSSPHFCGRPGSSSARDFHLPCQRFVCWAQVTT